MAPTKPAAKASAASEKNKKHSCEPILPSESSGEPAAKLPKLAEASSNERTREVGTPKHTRHAIRSVKPSSPAKPASREMKVSTTAVQSMDMIAFIHGPDGEEGAFCWPFMQFCNSPSHSEMIVDKAHIHGIYWMRHPQDPQAYYEDSKGRMVSVALSLLPPGKQQGNTAANREAFGRNLCEINNSPLIQATYKFKGPKTQMKYTGDLAPLQLDQCKKLSSYLTIDDIWYNVVVRLSSDPETNMSPSNEELLQDLDFLLAFYEEDIIPKVKQRFSSPNSEEAHGSAPEDFGFNIAPLDFE